MVTTATPTRRRKLRPGRPAGKPPNRQAILSAAIAEFSEQGYDAATMRGIAARAGVDLALLYHYYGSKEQLFVAALQFPENPRYVATEMLAGGMDGLGERIVRRVCAIWERGPRRMAGPFVAIMRSAASHGEAARMIRQFFAREVLERVARSVDVPQPQLRAALVASQLLGLAWIRYVVKLEPIASADTEAIVAFYAPTIQRYLTGPLPGDSPAALAPAPLLSSQVPDAARLSRRSARPRRTARQRGARRAGRRGRR